MAFLVDAPATLGSVLDQLGPLVAGWHGPAGDEERPVTAVVIDDAAFGTPLAADSLVLGIGAVDDHAVHELVGRAVVADAAAVLVKRRAEDGPVPGSDRTTVVSIAPDVSWEQLHAFARTAVIATATQRTGPSETLFDVANRLAVLVDGAIVIEDDQLQVLAYSSLEHPVDDARRATILGRQIPGRYVSEIRGAGVTAHLASSAEPVRFDLAEDGMLPRLAIALRTGGRTIGLVWAITDDDREAVARRILRDTAPDIAVEVLRHLTAEASRASDRLAAATQLLEGQPVPGLRRLLGSDADDGFVVVSLQPADTDGDEGADPVGRLAQFATVYVDAHRTPALVAPVTSGQVDLVLGLSSRFAVTRARGLLDELRDRASTTLGAEVHAAMGAPVPDVRRIPASRRDAIAVLDVLRTKPGGAISSPAAGYEEVRAAVALVELGRLAEGAEHLRRGPLADLMASTASNDRQVLETLRAWLDAGCDVSAAAQTTGVHPNTVRYRLTGFQERTGLDLSDPVTRLVAHLQLLLDRPGHGTLS